MKMSATNRGGKRIRADFYQTPVSVIKNFLAHHKVQSGNILDPSAGSGNFAKAIKSMGYTNPITSIEIRREEYETLKQFGGVFIEDFLNWHPDKEYKTIITNPPYSIALDFLKKSFEIAGATTEIIMLLRLAFLESKKRFNFWQHHPVNRLYVLSRRPSFTEGGTDATAYAWFVWDNSNTQMIKVI